MGNTLSKKKQNRRNVEVLEEKPYVYPDDVLRFPNLEDTAHMRAQFALWQEIRELRNEIQQLKKETDAIERLDKIKEAVLELNGKDKLANRPPTPWKERAAEPDVSYRRPLRHLDPFARNERATESDVEWCRREAERIDTFRCFTTQFVMRPTSASDVLGNCLICESERERQAAKQAEEKAEEKAFAEFRDRDRTANIMFHPGPGYGYPKSDETRDDWCGGVMGDSLVWKWSPLR